MVSVMVFPSGVMAAGLVVKEQVNGVIVVEVEVFVMLES